MLQTFRRLTLLLVAICGLGISAFTQQLNIDKIEATVVQGEQWAQVFTSTEALNFIYDDVYGVISGDGGGGNDNIYFAKFLPEDGFEGVQDIVVEYVDFFGQKWYTEVRVNVVKSKLTARNDYLIINNGQSSGSISVLSNDEGSEKNILLISVDNPKNGTVELDRLGIIKFTPDEGFTGITTFHYTIGDTKGTTSVGKVIVNVASTVPTVENTYFTVVNTARQMILLPDEGFKMSRDYPLAHGEIVSTSPFTYEYVPTEFTEGIEIILFVDENGNRQFFEIEIIDNQDEIDFVVDDEVYTNVAQYVSFDVRKNDYDKGGVVVDYSDELIFFSGVFAYHPPAGFSGVKQFYYVVHDGFSAHRGEITVFVGDYLPQKTQYDLMTRESTPLVLEYKIPLSSFTFNVINSPANGSIQVNQSVYGGKGLCDFTTGHELIVYQPNTGFTGTDAFSIEYCTDKGTCRTVDISMTVEEASDDCHCFGSDCVWAGDTNNDGKVSIVDLLPIGYHYGESGNSRQEEAGNWGAMYSNDWVFGQKESGENQKYVDSDGNGIINADDTLALVQNYEQYHNLVPQDVLVVKDFLIEFDQTEIVGKAGDYINFSITLGSDVYPVLDLQGLAFSLQFPTNLVDDNSMDFTFTPDTWFGYGTPYLSLVQDQNSRGRLDIAIVRTDGTGISGQGKLGDVGLTIIEDLDGVRPEGETIPIDLEIKESVVTDGSGQLYKINAGKLRINLQLDPENVNEDPTNVQVVSYPNPSNGSFTLHANNRDIIHNVVIFNSLGQIVYEKDQIDQRSHQLTSGLSEGIYFAHVTTQRGKAVEKIQIARR